MRSEVIVVRKSRSRDDSSSKRWLYSDQCQLFSLQMSMSFLRRRWNSFVVDGDSLEVDEDSLEVVEIVNQSLSSLSRNSSSSSLRSLLRRRPRHRLPLWTVMSSSSFSSSSPIELPPSLTELPPSLPLHLNHHLRHCHHPFLPEHNENIIPSLHVLLSLICLKYHNLHVFITCFQIISVCQLIFSTVSEICDMRKKNE